MEVIIIFSEALCMLCIIDITLYVRLTMTCILKYVSVARVRLCWTLYYNIIKIIIPILGRYRECGWVFFFIDFCL